MQFPLFLSGVDKSKVQELGEEAKRVLDEALRRGTNMLPDFLGNLVKVVQLVADDSYQVANGLVVVLAVVADLLDLDTC